MAGADADRLTSERLQQKIPQGELLRPRHELPRGRKHPEHHRHAAGGCPLQEGFLLLFEAGVGIAIEIQWLAIEDGRIP